MNHPRDCPVCGGRPEAVAGCDCGFLKPLLSEESGREPWEWRDVRACILVAAFVAFVLLFWLTGVRVR